MTACAAEQPGPAAPPRRAPHLTSEVHLSAHAQIANNALDCAREDPLATRQLLQPRLALALNFTSRTFPTNAQIADTAVDRASAGPLATWELLQPRLQPSAPLAAAVRALSRARCLAPTAAALAKPAEARRLMLASALARAHLAANKLARSFLSEVMNASRDGDDMGADDDPETISAAEQVGAVLLWLANLTMPSWSVHRLCLSCGKLQLLTGTITYKPRPSLRARRSLTRSWPPRKSGCCLRGASSRRSCSRASPRCACWGRRRSSSSTWSQPVRVVELGA